MINRLSLLRLTPRPCLIIPKRTFISFFNQPRTLHRRKEEQHDHWTADEDLSLQVAIQKHGVNWSKVVQSLPGKTPFQCKRRWKHITQSWRNETPGDKEKKLQGSKQLVGLAMAGNFTLCLCKLGASIQTGSTSLFSEAIHSFVDMINQGLLLIGIHRSLRDPNLEHPYGFHREQYAWAIISAVGILFVGGGVPIFSGAEAILSPSSVIEYDNLKVAYGVLGLALVAEGFTASKAFLQVKKSADSSGVSIREYLMRGSDPSSVQVLLEDSSSVCGTIIAGSCLTASYYLQNPAIDACGSIAIGGLLSSVAVFLLRRNMKMILETAMPIEKAKLVTNIISSDPVVASIQDVKTASIGPEHSRFKAEVAFNGQELTRRHLRLKEVDLAWELTQIKKFKQPQELQAYLTSFGAGVVEQLADEIDRLEDNIKSTVPEVKHVDIEVN